MDTFRKEYTPLTETQTESVKIIKERAEELEEVFNRVNTPNIGREIALAKTNLEQAVMWAVKAVTTKQE